MASWSRPPVERRIEFARAFAERALIMERGHCAWTGSAAALRADAATVERLLGVALSKTSRSGGTVRR